LELPDQMALHAANPQRKDFENLAETPVTRHQHPV
jgi:hypothetical protein